MHTLLLLSVPLIMIVLGLDGYRRGAFFSFYCLVRNLLAFLVAMAYCEPVTELFVSMSPERLGLHPGPLYWRAIFFGLLFGVVFGCLRWLKLKFTPAKVEVDKWADRIAGPVLGLINGFVLSGFILILWSLMPFAKFLPGDFGRMDPDRLLINSGGAMLRYFNFTTGRLPGRRPFLLQNETVPLDIDTNGDGKPDRVNDRDRDGLLDQGEQFLDVNGNRQWDIGWMWRYHHFAEISYRDFEGAQSVRKVIYEHEEFEGD